MLRDAYPYYLANRPESPNCDLVVRDKYTNAVATRVPLADESALDRAIARAAQAAEPMRRRAAYERQAVLSHCARRFEERAEELAYALCVEAGKPIRDSRGEVTRLVDTFRIAAEESVRMTGEVMPTRRRSDPRAPTAPGPRLARGPSGAPRDSGIRRERDCIAK